MQFGYATMAFFFDFFLQLELAEICQHCERYIGTEGGGMDQSISFLAQSGTVGNHYLVVLIYFSAI
jgi:galactokinase